VCGLHPRRTSRWKLFSSRSRRVPNHQILPCNYVIAKHHNK
jgi:hypothetical protein